MKTASLLFLVVGSFLFTACEVAVVDRRPVTVRRYATTREHDHDHRQTYYRRHSDDHDATYRTRTSTRRYYSRPGPIDRSYGF